MPVLTEKQLARGRRDLAEKLDYNVDTTGWTREQLTAAMQAIEDWWEAQQTNLNGLINQATGPTRLTPRVKKALLVAFMRKKLDRVDS